MSNPPSFPRGSIFALACLLSVPASLAAEPHSATPMVLWYRKPADIWTEALPVGNGRLGAMVFGSNGVNGQPEKMHPPSASPLHEHLQLNEDTVWQGSRMNRENPKAAAAIPEIRRLLFEGKVAEAEKLADSDVIAVPRRMPSYSTLGDLHLDFSGQTEASDYRRDLDLSTGMASVSYLADGVRYRREVFASAVDNVIVVRLTASKPGSLSFSARFDRPEDFETRSLGPDTIQLREGAGHKEAIHFRANLKALSVGGTVRSDDAGLVVTGADSVTLLIAAATDFSGGGDIAGSVFGRTARDPDTACADAIASAGSKKYESLRDAHMADQRRLFEREWLQLGSETDPLADVPTDERLRRVREGAADEHLEMIYFQFARYLLIGCSRPGGMPANLQGLWAWGMENPWGSKYTININTEMNYWIAEPANLDELYGPFADLIDAVRDPKSGNGVAVSRDQYHAAGFVIHHNTDVWGDAVPIDGVGSGVWAMGGAWMTLNLWDRFTYTGDRAFLADRAYPAMRDAALFLLDYLVDDGHGHLVTGPSISPENSFLLPDGSKHRLVMAPTMDTEITRELLTRTAQASELLGRDAPLRSRLLAARDKLRPFATGKYGQLLEWPEDYAEAEPGHRHISHLWALYPASQISPRTTPGLAKAAQISLQRRLDHGGGGTGWSRAWVVNCWARLLDGDKAHESLEVLLSKSTLPNMFDNHPPFQIDGNFGGAAGMAEMLLQSSWGPSETEVDFLPALPKVWADGAATGFRVRGGVFADVSWKSGRIVKASLRATVNTRLRLRGPAGQEIVSVSEGGRKMSLAKGGDGTSAFSAEAGHSYDVGF